MSAPLDGLRVIDLSINSPGPLATMMLAEPGIGEDEYSSLQSSGITR